MDKLNTRLKEERRNSAFGNGYKLHPIELPSQQKQHDQQTPSQVLLLHNWILLFHNWELMLYKFDLLIHKM